MLATAGPSCPCRSHPRSACRSRRPGSAEGRYPRASRRRRGHSSAAKVARAAAPGLRDADEDDSTITRKVSHRSVATVRAAGRAFDGSSKRMAMLITATPGLSSSWLAIPSGGAWTSTLAAAGTRPEVRSARPGAVGTRLRTPDSEAGSATAVSVTPASWASRYVVVSAARTPFTAHRHLMMLAAAAGGAPSMAATSSGMRRQETWCEVQLSTAPFGSINAERLGCPLGPIT